LDKWVFIVDTFDLATRSRKGYLNGTLKYSATVPSNEKTVLEWNPDTATYPYMYRRLTIGANVRLGEFVNEVVGEVRIYNRTLSDAEIKTLYNYPDASITQGLVLWFKADPNYVKDIDNDGIPEWIDLSGYNNHGKIYGAMLVQIIKNPNRVSKPARVLPVAR
jgi:hypothetical protein